MHRHKWHVADGSWPCQNVGEMAILAGFEETGVLGLAILIATINVRTPTMLITPRHVVGEDVQRHPLGDPWQRFH
jgi:hypothetical protein